MRLAKLVSPALAFGLIIANTPCGRADEKTHQPKTLILIGISTDAKADNEFGHTVYGYSLFDDGKAVSARHVYNWAVQNIQSKKLNPEQVKEVMRLVKGLPKQKGGAVPRQFLVRVWFAGQDEADRLEFDHRKLPADLERVLELMRPRPQKYTVEEKK
jgi:hypothetical protein